MLFLYSCNLFEYKCIRNDCCVAHANTQHKNLTRPSIWKKKKTDFKFTEVKN